MGLGWQKKLQNSQETSLKGPTRDLVLTQTYCLWYSAPGATAGKAEEAYEEKGRKVKWLVRGWVLGRQLPPGQSPEARRCHCPLIGPSPHRATKQQNGLLCPGDYLRLHPTQFTGDFSTIGHDTKTGRRAALTNTQKQTQWGCQIEETKKCGPNERTEQNSRQELNEMKITNLSDAEFKTLVIRMLKEITGYCNSIFKKGPGRNEGRITWKEKSTGN